MKEPHFLFNPQLDAEQPTDMLSVYLQSDTFAVLKQMTEQHGHFHLESTTNGFDITVGQYRFIIEDYLDVFRVSMVDSDKLQPASALLLIQIAYFLFHDRHSQCKLEAVTIQEEALLWHHATDIGFNITSNNPTQGRRFTAYIQHRHKQQQQQILAPFQFSAELEAVLQKSAPIHPPQQAPSLFGPNTPKQQTTKRYRASVFMDCNVFSHLKELVRIYGGLSLSNTPTGFELALEKNRITVSAHHDLYRISLINQNTLKIGAAELLAKAIYYLFYDKYGVCRLDERNRNNQPLWNAAMDVGLHITAANDQQKQQFQKFAHIRSEQFRKQHQNMLTNLLRKTAGPNIGPNLD